MPTEQELLAMYPICDDDKKLRATCPCKNVACPLPGRCRPCVVWHCAGVPSTAQIRTMPPTAALAWDALISACRGSQTGGPRSGSLRGFWTMRNKIMDGKDIGDYAHV